MQPRRIHTISNSIWKNSTPQDCSAWTLIDRIYRRSEQIQSTGNWAAASHRKVGDANDIGSGLNTDRIASNRHTRAAKKHFDHRRSTIRNIPLHMGLPLERRRNSDASQFSPTRPARRTFPYLGSEFR